MAHAITGLTVFAIVSMVMVLLGWAYWQGYSDGRRRGAEDRSFEWWDIYCDGVRQGRQEVVDLMKEERP